MAGDLWTIVTEMWFWLTGLLGLCQLSWLVLLLLLAGDFGDGIAPAQTSPPSTPGLFGIPGIGFLNFSELGSKCPVPGFDKTVTCHFCLNFLEVH